MWNQETCFIVRSVIAAAIWIIAGIVVSTLVWGGMYNSGVKWLVTRVVSMWRTQLYCDYSPADK